MTKTIESSPVATEPIEIAPYDTADYLESDDDRAGYLEACLEIGDAALIAGALGVIARSKGMTQMAHETGLTRDGLYKALSPAGNPEFATVLKVLRALGLRLHVSSTPL